MSDRCYSIIGVILLLIRCRRIFDVCEIKLIIQKSLQSWAIFTLGMVMKIFLRKSSGSMPVLYIKFISLVIVCIPFSPKLCRNSAGMLSDPVALFRVNFWITVFTSNSDITHLSWLCFYRQNTLYRHIVLQHTVHICPVCLVDHVAGCHVCLLLTVCLCVSSATFFWFSCGAVDCE